MTSERRTPRISPNAARDRLRSDPGTLVVCAYDDDEKCRAKHLDGAIPLSELERKEPAKDQRLIFYCA